MLTRLVLLFVETTEHDRGRPSPILGQLLILQGRPVCQDHRPLPSSLYYYSRLHPYTYLWNPVYPPS